MSKISTLVNTIISLKRSSSAQVAKATGIGESNLSRYLTEKTDIRSSSFIALLQVIGVDIEAILLREIDILMGRTKAPGALGKALETLIRESDPTRARTSLETFAKQMHSNSREAQEAIKVITAHVASTMKTERTA